MGMELKAGQFITGRKKLAEELGFSEQQIRTAISKLESTGEISIFSTNKYSIITVTNWENYQGDFNEQPTENAVFCEQIVNEEKNLKLRSVCYRRRSFGIVRSPCGGKTRREGRRDAGPSDARR
jgi:biotin operon repressor